MSHEIRRSVARGVLSAALLSLFPATARADAGIVMMPVQYPAILLFFVPVVLIETVYLQRHLKASLGRTLSAVAGVNLITMAMGYPLAWFLYTGLDIYVGFPAPNTEAFSHMQLVPLWLCARLFPDSMGLRERVWPVLGIFLTLMVPSYLLTRVVKDKMMSWHDLLHRKGSPATAVREANQLSYIFLAGVGCLMLYMAYSRM